MGHPGKAGDWCPHGVWNQHETVCCRECVLKPLTAENAQLREERTAAQERLRGYEALNLHGRLESAVFEAAQLQGERDAAREALRTAREALAHETWCRSCGEDGCPETPPDGGTECGCTARAEVARLSPEPGREDIAGRWERKGFPGSYVTVTGASDANVYFDEDGRRKVCARFNWHRLFVARPDTTGGAK